MNKCAFTDTVHSFSRICINWRWDRDESSPTEQWHRFFSLCVGIGMADGSWRIDEITNYHRRLRREGREIHTEDVWSGRWHSSEESWPTCGELLYAWFLSQRTCMYLVWLEIRSERGEYEGSIQATTARALTVQMYVAMMRDPSE